MKYFELVDTPELKYAPRLTERCRKANERKALGRLCYVEAQEQIHFTDFILSPLFLVSPDTRKVIELYEEDCTYQEVILLEEASLRSGLYYIPRLCETSQLLLRAKSGEPMEKACRHRNTGRRIPVIKRHMFVVRDAVRRHVIISLELAESLLYRRLSGIGLREVELIYKEKDA